MIFMAEVLLQAIANLKKEGIRTFLTLIGIIIGVLAIVSLLSIGNGLSITFENQFESIGTNNVIASPGELFSNQNRSNLRITERDLDNLRQIRNVDEVIAEYASQGIINLNNSQKRILLFTVDDSGFEFYLNSDFVELVDGRWLEEGEQSAVMINERLAQDTFDREINIRQQININGETYRVVGIFKFSSAFASIGPGSGIAFSSLNGFRRIFPDAQPVEILIRTSSTDAVEDVAEAVQEYFDDTYGRRSFTVVTSEQAIGQLGGILDVVTLVVVGIAAISLLVGGIGIMNAMYTSVLERRQEIGVMKALGATNNQILAIFLLESALIGLIGGIIGLILGFGLAEIVAFFSSETGLELVIYYGPEIILGALLFSILAGTISGVYPAYKAAKLDPVDALRNE